MPLLLDSLHQQLHQLGPLRREAWEEMLAVATKRMFRAARAVTLSPGAMLYIAEGLVKQCARSGRTEPDILRFLRAQELMIVPYNADGMYVKTLAPAVIYYWDEYTLRQLMLKHAELLKIYMLLRDTQEHALDIKLLLLGQQIRNKLILFDQYYPSLRAFIKNKDLANYLHVHESTLSRNK